MDKGIFNTDTFLDCPFDNSELILIENHGDFSIGDKVQFYGLNKIGSTEKEIHTGTIFAIGENAKYLDGTYFTAVIVKVGPEFGYLKNITDLTKI